VHPSMRVCCGPSTLQNVIILAPASFMSQASKIEKQAYQLAKWIVVSQLKTVLNDKFSAYC
jgi:hypothetical protein